MSREILFKAKRKDNGEWVEGYYRADPDLDGYFICGWIYGYSENGIEREPFEEEINPNTLCQYTGLADKNGQYIWENDIVRFEKYDAVVRFEKGQCVMKWIKEMYFREDFYYWATDRQCLIEVISNIFDNPDLLEVE